MRYVLEATMDKVDQLTPLFYPKSIAVVGASTNEVKFGGRFLQALIDFGYKGPLYPVNPKGSEMLGLKMYPSVKDIPGPVDLADIMVPARLVPQVLEDCLAKGVKGAQIFTSGFAETAEEQGRLLEEKLKVLAKRGIRVIGPNCFGVYCPEGGQTLLPGGDFPQESGPVAFVTQSGGHAVEFSRQARGAGIRFSKVVSYGNACDVNESDLLEYLARDDKTRIITMYLEGPREGKRFLRLVAEVARQKPVLIWKAGLTGTGARAVYSHTASLAGEEEIWEALFRQTAALRVNSLEELADATVALLNLPPTTGRRVGVVGGGGGISVAAADACDRVGLEVPPLSRGTQEKLRGILPPAGTAYRNPVDIGAPIVLPAIFDGVMEAVASEEGIETIIATQAMYHVLAGKLGPPPEQRTAFIRTLMETPRKTKEKSGKPVIIVLPIGGDEVEKIDAEKGRREIRDTYLEMKIPSFPTLERAARAVAHVVRYYEKVAALS
jgi:acyl-CoA synthetase (NDP forming)